MGRTTLNLVDAHIVLPNVDKILNFAEEDLFQMDVYSQTVDLHHLDDLTERADSRSYTQGIDAVKMFTTLRNESESTHYILGMAYYCNRDVHRMWCALASLAKVY